MNYIPISTENLSLKCEICGIEEFNMVLFGKVNNKIVCVKCINKNNLQDIDILINKLKNEKIEEIRVRIYSEIDKKYPIIEDGEKYDAEELTELFKYTNIVLELKYDLSLIIAEKEFLNEEREKLRKSDNLLEFVKIELKISELNKSIRYKEQLLLQITNMKVYQAINHYILKKNAIGF